MYLQIIDHLAKLKKFVQLCLGVLKVGGTAFIREDLSKFNLHRDFFCFFLHLSCLRTTVCHRIDKDFSFFCISDGYLATEKVTVLTKLLDVHRLPQEDVDVGFDLKVLKQIDASICVSFLTSNLIIKNTVLFET